MKQSRFTKLISVLLCVMLVVSLFPASALAEGLEGNTPAEVGGTGSDGGTGTGGLETEPLTEEPPAEQPPEEQPPEQQLDVLGSRAPALVSPSDGEEQKYSVTFKDWDGTNIGDVQQIVAGGDADEPAHPTRDGYEPNGWDKPFINVQEDLIITAQYTLLETYTLTINYLFQDNGVAAQPYIATVKRGEQYDYDVSSPIVDGFHPDQTALSGTLGGEDITITVLYVPDGSTVYKVQHYTQDLNGTTYSLYQTETLSGTTGSEVTAVAKSIVGFTSQGTMPTGRISADGKMVLAIYYTRNAYTVYFETDGTYIDPVTYLFGAAVANWPATPVRPGYTFDKWDTKKPATMPANNIIVTAIWKANKNTSYTLVYWLENITSDGYDFVGSSTKTGTTGNIPTIPGNVPGGITFPIDSWYRTYDKTKSDAENNKPIAGDGTTIVSVYYSRKSYSITFELNGGTMSIGGITYSNSRDYVITAKYGAYIGDKWPAVAPTKSGTTFVGWKGDSTYVTRQLYMDSELMGETLTAQYKNATKSVTIYYYLENLPGVSGGTQIGGKYYTENTNYRQVVNTSTDTDGWNSKTFEGFTVVSGYDTVSLINNTATFYYNRSNYTLSFNSRGTIVSTGTYAYGAPIAAAAAPTNGLPGYYFDGWYANQNGFGSAYSFGAMPAYNLILHAKWSPTVYTVTFDTQGGSAVSPQSVANGSFATEPTKPTFAGYNFLYWYLSGESVQFMFDREIHGDVTLLAKWSPATNISYTVKYQDGTGADIFPSGTVTGQTMGSTVYAQAPVKEGFLPDKVSKSITLGASNNAILFVYTPFTSITYTVRHVAADGSFDTSSLVTTTHAVVTENYVNHPGYSPDAFQKTLKLSLDASSNVITFHYSKNADKGYTVNHYKQNLGVSGYTLADTETLHGPVGYRMTAAAKSYTGFIYNSGISNASGIIKTDSSLVLNLYYDRATYTLGYDANGGVGTMPSRSGKYESVLTVAANGFTRDHYTFIGWKTSGGSAYSAGDPITLSGDITLLAQWQEKAKFTVQYHPNGGTGTMNDSNSPYYVDAMFTVLANTFAAPTNRHFTGWNSKEDGTGTSYAAGLSYAISDNVTLYAQWASSNQYTVTYYGNGGTGSMTDANSPYYENAVVTAKNNEFTYFGYDFTGWNTTADASGDSYAEGATVSITKDLSLYAIWEKDTSLWYTVAYDGNGNTGGTVPTDSLQYLKNTSVSVKTDTPTRTNAIFLGWSATQSAPLTTKSQADAVVFVGSTFIILSNTTLYSVWAVDNNGPAGVSDGTPDYLQYGIVYEGNHAASGSVPVNNNIYSSGASVAIAGNTGSLIRANAAFLGWSVEETGLVGSAADLPTPLYHGGNSLSMVSGGVTLYAVWGKDSNGPAGVPDGISDYLEFAVTYAKNNPDATGTVTDSNIYPDNYLMNVKSNSFALTGFVFDHWNTAADNAGTIANAGSTFRIHGNTTFYAIWDADANGPAGEPDGIADRIEYGVTYFANGGDATTVPVDGAIYPEGYSTPVLFTPVVTRDGYDFVGWAESPSATSATYTASGTTNMTMGTSDVKLYAVWAPHAYDITYVLKDGVNGEGNPATYTVESDMIVLKDPTKAGYTFESWTEGSSIAAGSTGNKTFTANWSKAIVYDITYVLKDGVNGEGNPATYTVESGLITLKDPIKAGYTFEGWTEGNSIAAGSTGNKTFTANWSTAILYDITYVLKDGVNGEGNPANYTVESDEILLKHPTKAGYTFEGWTEGNSIAAGSTGNKTFTANWSKAIVYDITYVLKDGINGEGNPKTYTVESGLITLKDPTKAGYTFEGWTEGNSIAAGSTGNKTFTANWSAAILYDITYVLKDGVNGEGNPANYTVESGLITLKDPTKAGYTFESWTEGSSIAAGSTGNKTFTANWSKAIVYDITYVLKDGINGEGNPANYTVESGLITLKDPTKAGYSFTGWTEGNSIAAGSTGNKTFTANWSAAIVYDITYDLGVGGVNGAGNPATYTVETDTFALTDPTRTGYYFLGWDTADTTIEKGSTGDKSYTANWAKKTELTLTANSATVPYNGKEQSVSGFTSSISGLTFENVTAGAKGTKANEYATIFAGQSSLVIKDSTGADVTNHYTVSYAPGKLTITKAILTATAVNRSMTYGNAGAITPAASVTYSGFVNGETKTTAGVSGTVSYTYLSGTTPVTVNNSLGAGSYAIRPVLTALTAVNYTFVPADGVLTVNPSTNLRVTVTGSTTRYDGSGHSVTATPTIPSGTTLLYSVEGGTDLSKYSATKPMVTNVSESKIIYVAAVNANYVTAWGSATVTITQRTINLTSGNASKIYDGKPLINATVTQTGHGFVTGEGFAEPVVASGTITNAGSTANTIVVPALKTNTLAENYRIRTYEGTLTVKKAVLTATAVNRTMTYGDTGTLTPAEAVVYAGFVNGETAETVTISGSVGYVYTNGILPVSVDNSLPVNTYTIRPNVSGLVSDNYTFSGANGTLTVTRSNTLTVSATSYVEKYDGLPHILLPEPSVLLGTMIYYSLTGGAYPGDYSIIVPRATDVADSKTVYIAAVNANYETAYTTASLTILPRDITLTSDGASKMYNGTPLTKPGVAVGGDGFLFLQGFRWNPYTTGTITNVGSTPNTIRVPSVNLLTNLNNYNIVKNEGTLTITPSNALSVTATPYTGKYDGQDHTIGASANIPAGTQLRYSLTGGADLSAYTSVKPMVKNVADNKTIYVAAVNPNYETSFASAAVTLTPRTIMLTSESASKEYDKLALERPTVTPSGDGFAPNEGFTTTPVASGSIINVGEETNTIVIPALKTNTLAGNYTIDKTEGKLTITASDALSVAATGYSGLYDGTARQISALASDENGTTLLYSTTGGTNLADYSAVNPSILNVEDSKTIYVAAVNSNYATAFDSAAITLTPRAIMLTSETASKEYDKLALERPTVTPSGDGFAPNEGFATTPVASGSIINVGEETNTIDIPALKAGTLAGNYSIDKTEGKLTITASDDLTVTATGYSGLYDGTARQISALASEGTGTTLLYSTTNSGDIADYSAVNPTILNVADSKTIYVAAVNSNYVTAFDSAAITLAKRAIMLTSESASKEYDTLALERPTVTPSGDGFAPYEGFQSTPVAIGSIIDVGEETNTIDIPALKSNTLPGNYTIDKTEGKLTITISDDLSVTATGYSGLYDGIARQISTVVSDEGGTTLLYSTTGGTDLAAYSDVNPSILNVADSKTIYVAAVNPNYVTAFDSAAITLTKRSVILTSGNASKTYNGTALTSTAVLRSGDGFVLDEEFATAPLASGTITNAGSTINTIVIPALNGFALAGNYNITKVEGTLTVNKAVLTATAVNRSMTYGDTGTLTPAEAVVYTGFITGESADTVAISGSASYRYTYGAVTVTPSNLLPVANYTIRPNVSGLSAANYSFVPGNGTLTVTKSNKLTVSADSYNAKYDGLPHILVPEPNMILGTLIYYSLTGGAYPGDYTLVPPIARNVADSKTVYIAAVNSNYETAYATSSFTITKRAITLTSGSDSRMYNGLPLTKPGATRGGDGFVLLQGFAGIPTATGMITDVGSTPNTIQVPALRSNTNANNYTITKLEGTLTITPSDALNVTATPYTDKYDGVEHTIGASANIPVGTELRYSLTGGADLSAYTTAKPMAKNVSDSKTIYVAAVNSNYITAFSSAAVTITPRAIMLTSETQSKNYDATPLTNALVTPSGDGFAPGEGFDSAPVASGTITDPGTAKNTIVIPALLAGTLAGNYNIQTTEGTLTIRPRVTYNANTTDPVTGIPATVWFDYLGSVSIAGATGITRTGYVLTGWLDQTTGETIALGATISPIDRNYDLLAVWTFDVFDTLFDDNTADAVTNMPASILDKAYTSTVTLPAQVPARAGYNFMGWRTTDIDGTTTTVAAGGSFVMPAKDVTFYAVWQIIISPVQYAANGGLGATYVEGYYPTFGDVTVDGNNFRRTGYTFLGWGTGVNSGVVYAPGDVFEMPDNPVTLYAQWRQEFYTVRYVVTGGTLDGLDGETPYAVYENLAYNAAMPIPDDPAEEDYVFDGWASAIPARVPVGGVTIYGTMSHTSKVLENIEEPKVPLASPAPTWALFNLILTVLTALASGGMIAGLLNKNKVQGGLKNKKRVVTRFSTIVPTIGAILAFVLTQNISSQMALFDKWSILMGGIAAVQGVLTVLGVKQKPQV